MKKIITIFLVVFGAVAAMLLIANLTTRQNQTSDQPASPIANEPVSPATNQNVVLDQTELAKHSSLTDCWLLINGKIYDVTGFLSSHPGGVEAMTPYCGRDASQAFATKDKSEPKPHSPKANEMLDDYYLGDLNQPDKASQLIDEPPAADTSVLDEEEIEIEAEIENETN